MKACRDRRRTARAQAGVVETRFTTREMLATEQALIDGALARRYGRGPRASGFAVAHVLAEYHTLSDEQRQVLRELCSGRSGVAVLRAAAGTGKTFALDAAREAWERSGMDVIGCALSARAAVELQDQAGIPSLTIAALRDRLDVGYRLPDRGVLVVDEAGMVGSRDLAALADAARRVEAKLVLVGDDRQLPEIDAGGAFRALAERLGASELHEVRRQREAWDRQALDALRNGDVERWARAYRDAGRITVARRPDEARAALVNDFARAEGDRVMLAARRTDVRDLNDRARQLLRASGELGPDELQVDGRGFAVGDRVVATRNDRRLGLFNGRRGTITDVDRERQTLIVKLDHGSNVSVDVAYLRGGHLEHGYAITAHRAQGATVDRAFVLGSDELYREWGYAALSRHRKEARFYITRGELGLDRDHAPEADPLVAGLERILGRSQAKQLALDGIRDLDQVALAHEHAAARERVVAAPPPPQGIEPLAREATTAREQLDSARAREVALSEQRGALGWFRHRERAQLDHHLSFARASIVQHEEHWQHAQDACQGAHAKQRGWLQRHGADAQQFLALDRERLLRNQVEREVHGRVTGIERGAEQLLEPPDRGLNRTIARDIGQDLDIGR